MRYQKAEVLKQQVSFNLKKSRSNCANHLITENHCVHINFKIICRIKKEMLLNRLE